MIQNIIMGWKISLIESMRIIIAYMMILTTFMMIIQAMTMTYLSIVIDMFIIQITNQYKLSNKFNIITY